MALAGLVDLRARLLLRISAIVKHWLLSSPQNKREITTLRGVCSFIAEDHTTRSRDTRSLATLVMKANIELSNTGLLKMLSPRCL